MVSRLLTLSGLEFPLEALSGSLNKGIKQSKDTLVPQNNLVSATRVAQNVPISFCRGAVISMMFSEIVTVSMLSRH